MNLVGPAPTKASFLDELGHPVPWINWFSDLATILNTMQGTGTTAQRPARAPYVGFSYFDTTINKPIWAKTQTPATWVDATGAPV